MQPPISCHSAKTSRAWGSSDSDAAKRRRGARQEGARLWEGQEWKRKGESCEGPAAFLKGGQNAGRGVAWGYWQGISSTVDPWADERTVWRFPACPPPEWGQW